MELLKIFVNKEVNMKTIVDQATGEIIEVEEANEVAERKLYEVGVLSEQVIEMINQYQRYKEEFEMFKYKLQQAMKENGIKSWKTDDFTATLKEESIQKRVDNDRLKEDGLYEKYLKLVPVKESLMIKFKEK